jgi:arginine decarboxylase
VINAAEPIARSLVGDQRTPQRHRPTFEVLMVADIDSAEEEALAENLRQLRRPEDPFSYELVFVPSFADALIAVAVNQHLQACVIGPGFRLRSDIELHQIDHVIPTLDMKPIEEMSTIQAAEALAQRINDVRPELDLYLVGHTAIETMTGDADHSFRRVFLRRDSLELHLSILRSVTVAEAVDFLRANITNLELLQTVQPIIRTEYPIVGLLDAAVSCRASGADRRARPRSPRSG